MSDAIALVAGADEATDGRTRALRQARLWALRLVKMALLAGLYYGAAKISYVLEFAGPVAAIVWFPFGVGMAFLYLGGPALWPGIVIGDLLANDYHALPVGSALGQTVGNVLEVMIGAVLLRRIARRGSPLESIRGVAALIVAVAVATAVSATFGTISLAFGGVLQWSAVAGVWRTWWLGDVSGALVLVPLALAWWKPLARTLPRRRAIEAVLLVVTLVAVSALASQSRDPLTYLIFPVLAWAALRFGARAATLAVAIAVGFIVWNTVHYQGPFVYHSVTRSVVSAQVFIAVAAVSTLLVAGLLAEREAFAGRLRGSRARVAAAADAERRRIERNLHDGAQQRLVALAVRLRLAADDARGAPEQAALLREAESEIRLAMDELRELAHGLHPAVLRCVGLAGGIETLAARSTAPVTVLTVPHVRVEDAVEATAYYVIAELITNAEKHARASSIAVRAAVAGRSLRVEVHDDGVGGATAEVGSGLDGLRDRVEAAGGSFRLDSPAGRGTRVAAWIPLPSADTPPVPR